MGAYQRHQGLVPLWNMEDCSTYLGLLLTHVLPMDTLMLTHYAHDILTNVEYQESFQVSKVLEYLYIYQSSTSE